MKEKHNQFTGQYKFKYGFAQPYLNRIYIYKYSRKEVLEKEWLHILLHKNLPGLPGRQHHYLFWNWK